VRSWLVCTHRDPNTLKTGRRVINKSWLLPTVQETGPNNASKRTASNTQTQKSCRYCSWHLHSPGTKAARKCHRRTRHTSIVLRPDNPCRQVADTYQLTESQRHECTPSNQLLRTEKVAVLPRVRSGDNP